MRSCATGKMFARANAACRAASLRKAARVVPRPARKRVRASSRSVSPVLGSRTLTGPPTAARVGCMARHMMSLRARAQDRT